MNLNVSDVSDRMVLTADMVIKFLERGNNEYVKNKLFNNFEYETVKEQYPKAVILSCIDSRIPVKDVFNCDMGDIFVARVAGNIINPDILGSFEYACKISGSKLIVVLGHNCCGAVKSAIDNVELGNITGLLDKLKPAINQSKIRYKGVTESSNPEFVDKVCHTNVKLMIKEIRKLSPVLKEMEDKGEIKIIGAMYDICTGKVDFFENM